MGSVGLHAYFTKDQAAGELDKFTPPRLPSPVLVCVQVFVDVASNYADAEIAEGC